MKKILLALVVGSVFITTTQAYDGKIVDATTKIPIINALVTSDNEVIRTGADGSFHLDGTAETLKIRAPGYQREEITTATLDQKKEIALTPFKVKGLYLTAYGAASHQIRNAALQVLKKNNMNALVIDVKTDRGFIPFKVNIPMADEIGSQKLILLKDMPALIAKLKKKKLYLIARIVTFKDDILAGARPMWAVKKNGDFFRDREDLRWTDPFRQEVWNYNIAIAKAAAEIGFDEIQFDYVRYPDTKGVVFSQPSTAATRTRAIAAFLEKAHKALAPYNVMVSADVFGYVAWNKDDTGIGQDINKIGKAVDIVSLMLYPSGFQFGIPGYRNPVQYSYEIVKLSLKRAQERTGLSSLNFRPWLQAFRDYAFGGEIFNESRMFTQIDAALDFGASGYMFWNPRNSYPKGNFTSKKDT